MQNATGTSSSSEDRNDLHSAIISGLLSLIESVRAGMDPIDTAIAAGAPGHQEIGTKVVVLDDVTPRYVGPRAALNSCEAHLATALRFLQPGTGEAGRARPVRSIGCA